MLSKLKGPLTAAMVSSLALVPATTVAYVATADIAVAKSDKAGGGGKGASQKSSKSKAGTKGKSGSKSASRSGKSRGHTGLDKFLGKLTGKKTVTKTKRASAAPKVAAAPKKALTEDAMHPSQLGKMNGALNANVNALIAHVKNGNTNGPIGGMAALAVAGYAAEGAAETITLYEDFAALDQMLIDNGYTDDEGNPDLQAYLDALEPTEGNGGNDVIQNALDGTGDLTLEEALMAENNGVQDFETLDDYVAWRDGTPGADPIDGADTLIARTDGVERPSDEDIAYAEDRIADKTSAEDYMLSIWNKGDGDDSMRSDAEEQLLAELYKRIEADGEALTGAIEEYADLPEPPAPDEGEDLTECAADAAECAPEEEIAAAE